MALQDAPEIAPYKQDVGAIKIDTQGHEPFVFKGMQVDGSVVFKGVMV